MQYQFSGDTTINFDSSMTVTQMQAKIDNLPKNLNGFTLTFQFADGTYSLSDSLSFSSFSNGLLKVQGNMSENYLVKHSNQAVILTYSGGSDAVKFIRCLCVVFVFNIKVNTGKGGMSATQGVDVEIFGCYINNSATTNYAFFYNYCNGVVRTNYVTKSSDGLYVANGMVGSYDNAELTTSPTYGLTASDGGIISKTSTQPVGATANQRELTGGRILTVNGAAIAASDPPTQAEMVAALGTAALGAGQSLLVVSTSGRPYLVYSDGTSWYYNQYTVGA